MANESVNVSLESNKKSATRGVYQKLSAEPGLRFRLARTNQLSNQFVGVVVRAYTMKHTVGVAVFRGFPVGQMEPRNLFNENFLESYPRI